MSAEISFARVTCLPPHTLAVPARYTAAMGKANRRRKKAGGRRPVTHVPLSIALDRAEATLAAGATVASDPDCDAGLAADGEGG